jgi:hypothetical protein
MEIHGCSYCLPIFIHSYYLHEGHTEKTPNATVTFVKFKNNIYGITCKHVLESLKNKRKKVHNSNYTLSINLGKCILQFSNIDQKNPEKRKDVFREIRSSYENVEIDIVIAPIHDLYWNLIQQKKQKQAINLDQWNEPILAELEAGSAFCFPNEHKFQEGNNVASPCIEIHAELANKLSAESTQITLFGTTEEPNQFFFSGVGDQYFYPIKVIFAQLVLYTKGNQVILN